MATTTEPEPVVARLSTRDRLLPVWIGAAMVAGLVLGSVVPGLNDGLDAVKVGQTSLPIALGLLLMMYPVLAKVRYREVGHITADKRMMTTSLILNWVIGPALMFTLAWLLLADQPEYRTGVILVGLARCIAMVLIWNDLACGDREMAAVLVALNAVFQVVAYAALAVFYLDTLPGWLGLDTESINVSLVQVAKTVLIFLGIPLAAGFLSRAWGEKARPRVVRGTVPPHDRAPGPLRPALHRRRPVRTPGRHHHLRALHRGPHRATAAHLLPRHVVRRLRHLPPPAPELPTHSALSFSAASNDFELAIAVAIGVFGVTSGQALAGVVGPLIEVPVLVGLVYVALSLRRRLTWPETTPDGSA